MESWAERKHLLHMQHSILALPPPLQSLEQQLVSHCRSRCLCIPSSSRQIAAWRSKKTTREHWREHRWWWTYQTLGKDLGVHPLSQWSWRHRGRLRIWWTNLLVLPAPSAVVTPRRWESTPIEPQRKQWVPQRHWQQPRLQAPTCRRLW